MCNFCTFDYGTSQTNIKVKCANYQTGYMVHEIRPLTSGEYVYFVRYIDKNGNQTAKSSVFIEYCPLCGDKLSNGMKNV